MKRGFALVVAVSMLAMPSAWAAPKPKPTTAGNSSSAKTKTGKTEWLLPKDNFVAKAGSTIALKFTLATGGNLVTSTSGVNVTASSITCPTSGPTSTGTLAVAKPGKSSSDKAFRFSGNSFMYEWKTAKNAVLGCYRFAVAGPGGPLTGPIVQIVAGD